jgi:hypothetical protein
LRQLASSFVFRSRSWNMSWILVAQSAWSCDSSWAAGARQMRVVIACERYLLHDTSNAEALACAQRQLTVHRLLRCAWTFLVHYAVSAWRWQTALQTPGALQEDYARSLAGSVGRCAHAGGWMRFCDAFLHTCGSPQGLANAGSANTLSPF